MQVRVGKDDNEWTQLVWTWFHQELKPGDRVFMPAGQTAVPFYERASREPTDLLKSLKYLQLDEIVSGPQAGAFEKFFRKNLTPFTDQFEWVGEAPPRQATAAVLGVGLNGHVAFHEPGLPRAFQGGRVKLSAETLQNLKLADPTWAVTYGAATFEACQKILILARGEKKRLVLERARAGEDLPISWFLRHPHCTLITDFPF